MSLFIHREPFKRFIKRCPVTAILVIIMIVVHIIDFFGIPGLYEPGFIYRNGALVPIRVKNLRQYERLFLSMFLHANLMHLLFNTFFGIAILGAGLEKLLGSVKYALVFLISGLGASLFIYFINLLLKPESITIGASGAIFGVLGVFLYIILFRRDLIFESDRQYLSGLIILNVVFTFIGPRISIIGHLGGLFAGFIIAFFLFLPGISDRLYHRRLRREWKKIRNSNTHF